MGDLRLITPYRRDKKLDAPTPTELQEKIIRIIEFHLGDHHLPFDKYLLSQMVHQGWVDASCFLRYPSIYLLTSNPEVIAEALKLSTSGLVDVAIMGTMIRRSPDFPLPIMNAEWYRVKKERSVLCRGFPTKGPIDIEKMWNYFQANYPTPVHVKLQFDTIKPHKGIKKQFNGSVKVVFSTRQEAETFMCHKIVKFNDYTVIRMWLSEWELENSAYFHSKNKEEPKTSGEGTSKKHQEEPEKEKTAEENLEVVRQNLEDKPMEEIGFKDVKAKRDWYKFCQSLTDIQLGSPKKKPRMERLNNSMENN